ncbi:MAG: glycosyltransferase, partial [Planctomycetia bacterium]
MARILVHALAATAGGGVTYLRSLLRHLRTAGSAHEWLVLAPESAPLPDDLGPNVELLYAPPGRGAVRRVWTDQVWLRQTIHRRGIQALLATGNFGMLHPPAPQVLLNRNALYFSGEHMRQLLKRGDVRELMNIVLRHRLALASIRNSAVNVVPTQAFADEIQSWLPELGAHRFRVVPHGFDHEKFVRPDAELDPELASRLNDEPDVKRILLVSHYNYFRNFETVFQGVAELKKRLKTPVELILTTKIGFGLKDHRY